VSIDLGQLDPDQKYRRDQWQRYLVVPIPGEKPHGYTRVTTVAKTLDSGGGLGPWKAAMTACGVIKAPGLRAKWEALLAEYGGNPWYASPAGKAACKALVEECATAGGADTRRDQGTALHSITAVVDAGGKPEFLTPETSALIAAYKACRDEAGITIIPDYIETMVVLDEYQVAGIFDRLACVPGYKLPLIADLKTGGDLAYSWQPIAVQLAAYSRANAIYQQGPAKNGSQDRRLEMPAVDQHHGLIFWLNAGTGVMELHLVDLDRGWEAFGHSMWTRGWRSTEPHEPYTPGDLTSLLAKSIKCERCGAGLVEDQGASWPHCPVCDWCPDCGVSHEPHADARVLPPQDETDASLREWLQDRIDKIGAHPKARADLGARWPAGLPTVNGSLSHTEEQFAEIERLLDLVEGRWGMKFPPAKPQEDDARVVALFPGAVEVAAHPSNTHKRGNTP
jgi:hypothetical protein